MVMPDFITLATVCAPAIHPTTLSAIVMQESQGNTYAIGVNGDKKLPHQPSTFEEAAVIAEQLERSGYDFDIGLGQINVKNLKWLDMSLFDLFNPCKNLRAVQVLLTHCYERVFLKYTSEQKAIQAALNCYNTKNFKRGFVNSYVQKIASQVGIKVPALTPLNYEAQATKQLSTVNQEKMVEAAFAVTSQDESVGTFTQTDVFTHTTSNIRDAFTTEDLLHSKDIKSDVHHASEL